MPPAGRFQPPVLADTRCYTTLTMCPGRGVATSPFMLVPFARKRQGAKYRPQSWRLAQCISAPDMWSGRDLTNAMAYANADRNLLSSRMLAGAAVAAGWPSCNVCVRSAGIGILSEQTSPTGWAPCRLTYESCSDAG